tara:strand:- start:230 stop:910 length:681 start_codon:yes stop_codon:yes gene_type:complete
VTSKLIVNSIRHTGASSDGITLASDGSVTLPGNATCSGTASGFSDYVKLQQASSAGGSGGLIFDNLDVATYKYFDFIISFVPETDNQHPHFRFRTGGASGSDVSGSHYNYGYTLHYPSNGFSERSEQDQGYIRFSNAIGNNTSNKEGIALSMRIHFADSGDNGASANLSNFIAWDYCSKNNSADVYNGRGSGNYDENTSTYPTGFHIYMDSGAINAHTYSLYGLKR